MTTPLAVVLTAVLTSTAGCGLGREAKEPKMNPEQAFTQSHHVVADVLDAIQPGASTTIGDSDRNVPCGGVEGNEYTKVRAAIDGRLDVPGVDLEVASKAAQKVLSRAGWTSVEQSDGDEEKLVLGFSGPSGKGVVILRASGKGTVSLDTTCLANPSSDNPHPDVQPST